METVSAPERYRRVRSISQQESSDTRVVDWSYRELKSLDGVQCMADIQHLILDGNVLERVQLPFMPYLMTLSLNENKIVDLERLCDNLRMSCPSLTHLSLIGNPACPHPIFEGGTEEDYAMYRRFILNKLPQLKFLDSTIVQSPRGHNRTEPNSTGAFPFRQHLHSALSRLGFSNPDERSRSLDDEDTNNNHHHSKEDPKFKKQVSKLERPYRGVHSEGNRFIRDNQL